MLTRTLSKFSGSRLLRYAILTLFALFLIGSALLLGIYATYAPELPSAAALREVQMQVPLRVYSSDGKLIAEFGEMKRTPVKYEEIPPQLVQAFLSAEDDRFFEHPGVDYQGLLRAALMLALTGEKTQGGSTITMQVARNFFLSSEKSYSRKIREIFLSLKIEKELSKEEILELYLNKIFLGQRAYGVASAAQVYYGKNLSELTLSQYAMIAGLPAAPSAYNPITNPTAAQQRRDYVLRRMHELGYIDDAQYQGALLEPVATNLHTTVAEIEAPYVAEMARAQVFEKYGEEAYIAGLKAYVTIDSTMQQAANEALRRALLDYVYRHGYSGPEAHIDLPEDAGKEQWQKALADYVAVGNLTPALVVSLSEKEAVIHTPDGELKTIGWDGMKWAQRYLNENAMGAIPKKSADVLKVGDIIRVETLHDGTLHLAEVPKVSGALVALRPKDGAVMALVGGFDFYQSNFNRVIQAQRQPGSNFKPFIYSAALENGFTAASIINDAPVVFEDPSLETDWRPENYSSKFYGPTRLREALVNSRNLVSVRILQSVGVGTALDYLQKFGFAPDRLHRDLSLALGTASLTPMEIVRGYATFANNGFLIAPYILDRVEDVNGNVVMAASPSIACDPPCSELEGTSDARAAERDGMAKVVSKPQPAQRTLSPQNVYIMTSIMQDVITRGTATGAKQLGRNDLAGKTGTTNEARDAWFSGFNQDLVATAWVGFDNPAPLGGRETGGAAALPMWTDFMRTALKNIPDRSRPQPEGLVSVRIDPHSGKLTSANNPEAIFEIFREEDLEQQTAGAGDDGGAVTIDQGESEALPGQIF
ncbi:MAG TPA: penicillin-binding protein 1A [Gammaproteobacteria bacterium]